MHQAELYTICHLAWNSASQHLAEFNAVEPKYDAAYITDRLAQVETTSLLPSEDERTAASALLRIDLTKTHEVCMANFHFLKAIEEKSTLPKGTLSFLSAEQGHFLKLTRKVSAGTFFILCTFTKTRTDR